MTLKALANFDTVTVTAAAAAGRTDGVRAGVAADFAVCAASGEASIASTFGTMITSPAVLNVARHATSAR